MNSSECKWGIISSDGMYVTGVYNGGHTISSSNTKKEAIKFIAEANAKRQIEQIRDNKGFKPYYFG